MMSRRRLIMMANINQEVSCDNYLTIEALEDDLTVSFSVNPLQYSIDNCKTWIELPAGTTTPAINTGEKISFKATGLTPTSNDGIGTFSVNKQFNLSGNCMSMLFGDEAESNLDLTGYNYAFVGLFRDCTTLKSVSSGFLPATTLASGCYRGTFSNCNEMTTAPALLATRLVSGCYNAIFRGCSSLNYIKAMFISTPNGLFTNNWVAGVASMGIFVKNAAATWNVTGVNGVPENWTIITEASE